MNKSDMKRFGKFLDKVASEYGLKELGKIRVNLEFHLKHYKETKKKQIKKNVEEL